MMRDELGSSGTVVATRRPAALTERQVAEQLGLSVATLRARRHRGKGPIMSSNRSAVTSRGVCWSTTRTFVLTRSGRRSTRWSKPGARLRETGTATKTRKT
jgi:hypothetical protein